MGHADSSLQAAGRRAARAHRRRVADTAIARSVCRKHKHHGRCRARRTGRGPCEGGLRLPLVHSRPPHRGPRARCTSARARSAHPGATLARAMARSPTAAELRAARGRTIPDVLAPGLAVVFCGINPSLYSAAVGHHFARPGNRFWQALHDAGFTDRLLAPAEDRALLAHGCGLTNLVPRATASADELRPEELAARARAPLAKPPRVPPRRPLPRGVPPHARRRAPPSPR